MPIPDYQTLMLPLLRRLSEANGTTSVRDHVEAVADEFDLTEEERSERIPSGAENLLTNRLHWARTYMGKAGLTESPKRGLVQITERGKALLAENPPKITNNTLKQYPEFVEWLEKSKPSAVADSTEITTLLGSADASTSTPLERIGQATRELQTALRADLITRVRDMTPAEFENLIVCLLLAMGYGQGLEEMGKAIGGSGDKGIDGVINQDSLGLERVYIQAKRYKEGNNVSSPDIRNFIGALNIHRAHKGVFVTASAFTSDALSTADVATVQVVLIDGDRLADLMIRYNVGVLVRSKVEIKELDEGFFDD